MLLQISDSWHMLECQLITKKVAIKMNSCLISNDLQYILPVVVMQMLLTYGDLD